MFFNFNFIFLLGRAATCDRTGTRDSRGAVDFELRAPPAGEECVGRPVKERYKEAGRFQSPAPSLSGPAATCRILFPPFPFLLCRCGIDGERRLEAAQVIPRVPNDRPRLTAGLRQRIRLGRSWPTKPHPESTCWIALPTSSWRDFQWLVRSG